jgi:hypothetical protein
LRDTGWFKIIQVDYVEAAQLSGRLFFSSWSGLKSYLIPVIVVNSSIKKTMAGVLSHPPASRGRCKPGMVPTEHKGPTRLLS